MQSCLIRCSLSTLLETLGFFLEVALLCDRPLFLLATGNGGASFDVAEEATATFWLGTVESLGMTEELLEISIIGFSIVMDGDGMSAIF